MSSKSDTNLAETSAPDNEVDGWRRLVDEQKQIVQAQAETIEKLEKLLLQQKERINSLEAEIRAQKKLKGKPRLSASKLNQSDPVEPKEGKRPGSEKDSKKNDFQVDKTIVIEPSIIPKNAKFNGYREYDVQEIIIRRNNIRFLLAEYVTEDGTTLVGKLPKEYIGRHYGPLLICYVMYQHYQCRVPQPLIYEQLREWGIDISVGQVNRLLNEDHQVFEIEQQQVLRVGLETATYIHTDDTGARHKGKNGYCTVIGNEYFAYFKSSDSKSRKNFLEMLQGEKQKYVLNEYARQYLENQPLAKKYEKQLIFSDEPVAENKTEWSAYLLAKEIVSPKTVQMLSEAALLGGIMTQNLSEPLRIISDGAGQFNIMQHGLCWVHAERILRKLEGNTKAQRENIAEMQGLLWDYYQQLKQYQHQPTDTSKTELEQKFDKTFGRFYEHHVSLNNVLNQMRNHKTELLQVLDCPRFPLHNNAAETDIREYVTRRKISGGTRSENGRIARDVFVGLKKTCRKLGISFWDYLMSRLHVDEQVPPIPDVIRLKTAVAVPAPT